MSFSLFFARPRLALRAHEFLQEEFSPGPGGRIGKFANKHDRAHFLNETGGCPSQAQLAFGRWFRPPPAHPFLNSQPLPGRVHAP